MSFVITLNVREGIVMAADSRITLNREDEDKATGKKVTCLAVGQSDSNYKLFQTPQGFGIAIFGDAAVGDVPIAGYIETFMREQLGSADVTVDTVPDLLVSYFGTLTPKPKTQFHLAGYQSIGGSLEQRIWQVNLATGAKSIVNAGQHGAAWGGEGDILSRLLQPLATIDDKGTVQAKLRHFGVPFQFFTLQDAIDFAIFAVRSTIDVIRFQPRPKTVGGPIDVLVIKPSGTFWVQRKELHGERRAVAGSVVEQS